jgi:fido (protein-threonine AMPylation protein)
MSKRTHLRKLYDEIEGKRRETIDYKDIRLVNHKTSQKLIEKEAKLTELTDLGSISHSARIEHPLAHINRLPKSAQKEYRKELRRITKGLQDAWITAKLIYPGEGELSQEFLTTIARKIEPEKVYGIRREQVLFGSIAPPEPQDVERELMFALFENKEVSSPLEKALHAHFSIVRVHPYLDGNGRTARLVQNAILNSHEYPSIIVDEGERHFYFDLMEGAIHGYDSRESNPKEVSREEELLYEFLATKVNIAYDNLLKRSSKYSVNFQNLFKSNSLIKT